ncbi:MAG: F510_1955 family glycosylhydrolase [Candidatus Limnocylindrales bacterium]
MTLAACGDDGGAVDASGGDAGAETVPAPGDQKAELEHIHGLGVDPSSGALYVATHYGLFQAPKGQVQLERMGESRQDIMGFSVVGPRRFLGSGHPDPSQNQPPNLGLIESRDGGTSWKNISLLGEADFHVLRSSGRKVYGFNGGTGKLMVSDDGGRKWASRTPPAAMFDLAMDPSDSNRVVASTGEGIFVSRDAGKGWRPLSGDVAGLLAWPSDASLFLVDGQGQVSRSTDAGQSFAVVGTVGGPPSAFISHGDDLLVALGDGNVVRSTDAGANWQVTATP